MTSVIGINIPESGLAVLAADRQGTRRDAPEKTMWRKLWIANDGMYAFGHSGLMDEKSRNLVRQMENGAFDMEGIVKRGYFPELRKLNFRGMGRKMPNIDDLSSFYSLLDMRRNVQDFILAGPLEMSSLEL